MIVYQTNLNKTIKHKINKLMSKLNRFRRKQKIYKMKLNNMSI